jgi:Domain of unknown function (DUF4249)
MSFRFLQRQFLSSPIILNFDPVKTTKLYLLLFFMLFYWACKKPFDSPAANRNYNYLVVEGIINLGTNKITQILLSRTKQLNDTSQQNVEAGARITIQAEQGSLIFPLSETSPGVYKSSALNLSVNNRYRLSINTRDGNAYTSEFVGGKITPPIDSLNWAQKTDSTKNVEVFVSSSDPLNNTKYYRWDFTETWQYRAEEFTNYGVLNGLIFFRDSIQQVYNCWRTASSTQIVIASSTALSRDVISRAKVHTVIKDNERLGIRYSINVRQYALSEDAFQYWQILQKNTQQLGTVFDPQPSQLKGNFTNINDPAEPVIGFLSASSITEKRLYINNSDLTNWNYTYSGIACVKVIIGQDPNDYRVYNYLDTTFAPYYFITAGIVLSKKDCLDCTRQGGTNIKPTFW